MQTKTRQQVIDFYERKYKAAQQNAERPIGTGLAYLDDRCPFIPDPQHSGTRGSVRRDRIPVDYSAARGVIVGVALSVALMGGVALLARLAAMVGR